MSYKKILILFVVIILVAVGLNLFLQEKTVEAPVDVAGSDILLVGGDRDEHGCIGSAGYVWCEAKEECLRPWEDQWDESCNTEEFDYSESSKRGFCSLGDTKICEDGSVVRRIAPDCEFEKCPEELTE